MRYFVPLVLLLLGGCGNSPQCKPAFDTPPVACPSDIEIDFGAPWCDGPGPEMQACRVAPAGISTCYVCRRTTPGAPDFPLRCINTIGETCVHACSDC